MTGRAEPYRTATCKTLASKTKRVTQPSEYPSVRYWSKEINASGTSTCRPPRCRRRRPGPAGSITRRPGMTRVGPGPGPDRTIVTATPQLGTGNSKLSVDRRTGPGKLVNRAGLLLLPPVTGSALQLAATALMSTIHWQVDSSKIPYSTSLLGLVPGPSPGPGPSCYHDRAT